MAPRRGRISTIDRCRVTLLISTRHARTMPTATVKKDMIMRHHGPDEMVRTVSNASSVKDAGKVFQPVVTVIGLNFSSPQLPSVMDCKANLVIRRHFTPPDYSQRAVTVECVGAAARKLAQELITLSRHPADGNVTCARRFWVITRRSAPAFFRLRASFNCSFARQI